MTDPLQNIWFLLAIILTVVSIAIRVSTDKSPDHRVWYAGLHYAVITATMAVVCVVVALLEITSP
jgi:hypothetical protein